jgi:hypothetical protein
MKTTIDEWQQAEERMNIIGRNGNDGLHYKEVEYWVHNCPENGITQTENGYPCNWCDTPEQ